MQITENQLRETYSQKETEELLDLQSSGTLTDLASLERRLVAYLIDFFLLVLVLLPINFGAFMVLPITIQDNISTGSFVLWIAYLLFKDSVKGQSIGKKILKKCVIDDDSGVTCSAPKSFFRNSPSLFGLIDWVFIFGKKQKRLGDYLAGISVINQSMG